MDGIVLEFFAGEGIASRFLAIHLSDPRYELDVTEIVKNCKIAGDAVTSFSGSAVTVDFKSQSNAMDGHKILSKCLVDNKGVRGISLTHVADHRLLRCRLFSDVRIDDQSDMIESNRILMGKILSLQESITPHLSEHHKYYDSDSNIMTYRPPKHIQYFQRAANDSCTTDCVIDTRISATPSIR